MKLLSYAGQYKALIDNHDKELQGAGEARPCFIIMRYLQYSIVYSNLLAPFWVQTPNPKLPEEPY